jgi:hypothetical protein
VIIEEVIGEEHEHPKNHKLSVYEVIFRLQPYNTTNDKSMPDNIQQHRNIGMPTILTGTHFLLKQCR